MFTKATYKILRVSWYASVVPLFLHHPQPHFSHSRVKHCTHLRFNICIWMALTHPYSPQNCDSIYPGNCFKLMTEMQNLRYVCTRFTANLGQYLPVDQKSDEIGITHWGDDHAVAGPNHLWPVQLQIKEARRTHLWAFLTPCL